MRVTVPVAILVFCRSIQYPHGLIEDEERGKAEENRASAYQPRS